MLLADELNPAAVFARQVAEAHDPVPVDVVRFRDGGGGRHRAALIVAQLAQSGAEDGHCRFRCG